MPLKPLSTAEVQAPHVMPSIAKVVVAVVVAGLASLPIAVLSSKE